MYYNGDYRTQQHPITSGDHYAQPMYSGEYQHYRAGRSSNWGAFWIALFTSIAVSAAMHLFILPILDKKLGREKTITVPQLKGLKFEDAQQVLNSLGLKIERLGERDSQTPPGTILSQIPAANSSVKKGSSIKVVVSRGSSEKKSSPNNQSSPAKTSEKTVPQPAPSYDYVTVPRVIGMSQSRAKRKLRKVGLRVGRISWGADEDKPPYWVLDQNPKPGEKVPKGSPVHLTVNPEDL